MAGNLFRQPGYQSLDDELYGGVHEEEIQFSSEDIPENSSSIRWDHIQNLDDFFTRVYKYHQRGGFLCMCLENLLQLFQFAFVVVFSVFLMQCVNYSILFQNALSHGNKTKLSQAVIPPGYCVAHLNGWIVLTVIVSTILWLFRFAMVSYNLFKYWEIRSFYHSALCISSEDLANMTWSEVQTKLLAVQKECQLCVHKAELTELDMYNRILRFENYLIAMVNKNALPIAIRIPMLGEYTFLTRGLKFNIQLILFRTSWSLFENYWHLKSKYKKLSLRSELCDDLSKKFLIVGILNLILMPLIFLWQILFSFFKYAELVKRDPSLLGSRRWSQYGRLYLRHFNELDHEFNIRLNRAYEPATRYMNCFTSQIATILAKNVLFFAGALLAVLIVLSVMDEDVLHVEHVLTAITLLGILVSLCRSVIPDENLVWCPELLLKKTLAHIHYLPDGWNWRGREHVMETRNNFSSLFQYKVTFLLEEMLSPLITPLMLIFIMRPRSGQFIDFFRNFTVEVAGVGDVCSFAQLDVGKHGNPSWNLQSQMTSSQDMASSSQSYKTERFARDGKIELSLMHFQLANPSWRPSQVSEAYLHSLRTFAQNDVTNQSLAQSFTKPEEENLLVKSQIFISAPSSSLPSDLNPENSQKLRGGVRNLDQPVLLGPPASSLMSSTSYPLFTSQYGPSSLHNSVMQPLNQAPSQVSMEMSLSALYLHEMHHRRMVMLTSRHHSLEPMAEDEEASLPLSDSHLPPPRPV